MINAAVRSLRNQSRLADAWRRHPGGERQPPSCGYTDVFLVSDQALAEDVTATKTQAFMSALDLDRLAIAEISRRLQHVKSELEQYNRTKRR
jgi:hypothetical protein